VPGALESQPADVPGQTFADDSAEDIMKMERRKTSDPGQAVEGQLFVYVPVDMIEDAEDPLVVFAPRGFPSPGAHEVYSSRTITGV
jgi:hypothetical protein